MKNLLACTLLLSLVAAGAVGNAAAQSGGQPAPSASPSAQSAPTTNPPQTPGTTQRPLLTARPEDVDTLDHIMAAVYDVISGPAGKRDWDRFRSLFYPGARLIPTSRNPQGEVSARVLTPDDYVTRGQPFFEKEGFFEKSTANRVESWDHIAHVWSTYESRHAKNDPKPFARGINSFQLFNDGNRWWVLSVFWEQEDPAHPIPEKYLH